ncbi:MAG: fasciclin domain-containing protein, partial [Longimonas sp.]|uniref:fasciclin domain-containing protein n=1 Tax=Longimonas sp. TaxID=2039626 RepID=UPI003348B7DA
LNTMLRGSRMAVYLLAMALVLSLAACDSDDPVSTEPPGNGDDDNGDEPTLLADILGERDDLTTLFTAVEESGQLDLTANPDADITVFAPNNSAFTDINLGAALDEDNEELLSAVVQYHVLPSRVLSSGLSEGDVQTAAGDAIRVTTDDEGNFLINGNAIAEADIEADNGVLHVIDGLLLENRSLPERLGLTASTESLVNLAVDLELAESFGEASDWTLFAPINEAIDAVDPNDFTEDELEQILLYHVIVDEEGGPIDSGTLVELLAASDGEVSVPTAQGEEVTFTQTEGGIEINGGQANIVLEGGVDRFTDNFANVFHLIDGVLLPPSFTEEDESISIAEARDLEDGTPVEVRATVSRVLGVDAYFQDETGGLQAFDGGGWESAFDDGDEVRFTGEMDTFNAARQLSVDDFEILSSGNIVEPEVITIAEYLADPEAFQGRLVRFEGVTIDDKGDDVFQAGGGDGSYDITDGSGETATMRFNRDTTSELVGEAIPDGTVTVTGPTTRRNDDFRVLPIRMDDLIEE